PQCVYRVDSTGAMVTSDVQDRVTAIVHEIGNQAQDGFHGHQNLSLGVANSVPANRAGARQIDGALCAPGAGAGNSPTEVLTAVFDRIGVSTGVGPGPRPPWRPRTSCPLHPTLALDGSRPATSSGSRLSPQCRAEPATNGNRVAGRKRGRMAGDEVRHESALLYPQADCRVV